MAFDGQEGVADLAPLDEGGATVGHKPATPHVIVLFGATGDLAKRKLLPGLFHLSRAGMLPECHIVATSLDPLEEHEYLAVARAACDEFARGKVSEEHWVEFERRIRFVPGHHGVEVLAEHVRTLESTFEIEPRRLHYLSIPPHAADTVVRTLGEAGLTDRARVIMEKPFGTDLHSCPTAELAGPGGIRRRPGVPDRPLPGQGGGPEHPGIPVRQRAVRADLEPPAHRPRADRRSRDPGVESRAAFYERPGPTATWWSPTSSRCWPSWPWSRPPSSSPGRSTRRRTRSSVPSGRSTPNRWCGASTRDTPTAEGVAPDSDTETFVALRCEIDNWRWAGVPFFLRTGKHLAEGARIVSIAFREPPQSMFPAGSGVGTQGPDHLTFDLAATRKPSSETETWYQQVDRGRVIIDHQHRIGSRRQRSDIGRPGHNRLGQSLGAAGLQSHCEGVPGPPALTWERSPPACP